MVTIQWASWQAASMDVTRYRQIHAKYFVTRKRCALIVTIRWHCWINFVKNFVRNPAPRGMKSAFIVIMTTMVSSHVSSEVSSDSSFLAFLLEPFLIVGSVLFWMLVLPLAAVARFSVGVYDAVAAIFSKARQLEGLGNRKPNPLVLRRGSAPAGKRTTAAPVAHQHS